MSRTTLRLLTPFFRHSLSRDAWILRGVGTYTGPVLVRRRPAIVHRTIGPSQGEAKAR